MSDNSKTISTRVSPDLSNQIGREAIRRSEPGDRVTVSDLVRETLNDAFGEGEKQ